MRSNDDHQNRGGYHVFGSVIFVFAISCLVQTVTSNAQHSSSNPSGKDDFIVPSRPTVSQPADIQKKGVLQLEFGLGASFGGEELRNQQTAPLALRFAALSRLLLAFQQLTFKSQVDRMGKRTTGVGGAIIGLQAVAFKKTGYPTFAFAYETKLLPTENKEKNPGSGRVDHRALLLIDNQVGGFDLSFNAAYLNVARKESRRRADGGLFALAFDYEFDNHFGVTGELAGQSLEYTLPRGLYPLCAVTYQVNRRLRFDAGLQFGIGAQAPRVSIVAGVVVGIANMYGK
jgi:Putative MetA-pathway of phenol degradation